MRPARAEVVLALVLTAVVVAPAAAQTEASSFADLQGRLMPDQTVYVQTADTVAASGRRIRGNVLELSGSTLRLLVNGQRREFSEPSVRAISVRRRYTGRGALIGLAGGAGVGLWGVAASRDDDSETRAWAVLGLVFFGGLGAGGGALAGHSLIRETDVFVAPDVRQSHAFIMTPFMRRDRTGLSASFRF
jgi:hypothetical protein